MKFHPFRLKSLMILVFASALACGVWVQVQRMEPLDWVLLREGSILFVPFFLMLAMKLGLVVAARARRIEAAAQPESIVRDEPLP
jgi:hypothetical protein